MHEIDPIEALQAAGLNPIIVDVDTNLDEVFGAKFETNMEFLDRVMNFGCPTGALIQAFIMVGLEYYCDTVQAAEMPDNGFVTAIAWKKTAEWLKGELNKKGRG